MLLNPSGSSMLLRLLHPSNVCSSKLFMPAGKATVVKL